MIELRENEAAVLEALKSSAGNSSFDELLTNSKLSDAAATRALTTLGEKQIVRVREAELVTLKLTDEGTAYAKQGLPERRVVLAVLELGGEATLEQASRRASISPPVASLALGWIKVAKWCEVTSQLQTVVLRASGIPGKTDTERTLDILLTKLEVSLEELPANLRKEVEILKRRKLITTKKRSRRYIELTSQGWKTIEEGFTVPKEVSDLTPELITSQQWKSVTFRKYNIAAPVTANWPGKRQPYRQFLDHLKNKLVNLGFQEMTGPTVELMFFNCDALFMPQDHPAREIHDIYFIEGQGRGDLGEYERFMQPVSETHENGWKTGSTGWKYSYSREEALKLILRSQGTALSARTLVSKDIKIPGKYFSIARCFRPDQVDRTHLTEFNQVEGIVVGADLSLRDLLGVLERFAIDIAGAEKVRFRPDYFPFTEPSVELQAYKEGYGWLEFGGSGIFRPELTLPLGINVPVIAWGIGADRLYMMHAGIEDIRLLFAQDLEWMRKQKVL
ncbi:MAG TPA: phenylalanine--tRNA ligase subunit alpha [Candidatus Acidoferrales bacterium]|nr:phenylalanine--tRNA ligase subunit alpha [Candidatus Acidoferrales bacterium]